MSDDKYMQINRSVMAGMKKLSIENGDIAKSFQGLHHAGNVVHWSGVSVTFDAFDPYLMVLLPPIWVSLLFLWSRDSSSRRRRCSSSAAG